jgi:hypothetical protein
MTTKGTRTFVLLLVALLLTFSGVFPMQVVAGKDEKLESGLTEMAATVLDSIYRSQCDATAQYRIDYDLLTSEAREIVSSAVNTQSSKFSMRKAVGRHTRMAVRTNVISLGINDNDTAMMQVYLVADETRTDPESGKSLAEMVTKGPGKSTVGTLLDVGFRKENGIWKVSEISSPEFNGGLFASKISSAPPEQTNVVKSGDPDAQASRCLAEIHPAGIAPSAVNKEKAIAYARKHALKKKYNKDYRNYVGHDCTNFTSQCLFAGGFRPVMKNGNIKDVKQWWYRHNKQNVPAKETCTLTWRTASLFPRFVKAVKRGRYVVATGATWEHGDLMAIDFEKDGKIDRQMIITGTDEYWWPIICSHSDDRLDVPVLDFFDSHKEAEWYVYHY